MSRKMGQLPFTLGVLLAIQTAPCMPHSTKLPHIGIIGGGIGGTATGQFLRDVFGDDVQIDLYEQATIGGRLATVEMGGRSYESGGSIIHPANQYMVNFTQMLGLKKKSPTGGALGVYNGEEMVFLSSQWEAASIAQMLWHYGWDVIKINQFVSDMLLKFGRIYEHQRSGYAFTTVEKLIESMSLEFMDYMQESIEAELLGMDYSHTFIDQLVMGGMRTNYGQTTDIHGFVGSVSLAGVQPGLWSVLGGNKMVPQSLLESSKVNHYKAKVTELTLRPSTTGAQRKYSIKAVNKKDSKLLEKDYDIVIIATPLHDNLTTIKFVNFPKGPFQYEPHYHRTVATFVSGTPNATYFGIAHQSHYPNGLLTCNASVFFNSIGMHTPVDQDDADNSPRVYKVFSQVPLSESQLAELFTSHDEVKVVDWVGAYPHYGSRVGPIPGFLLHEQLYYVNGIELAASAMEMSAIGAKNVALLAYNQWMDRQQKVDAQFTDQAIPKQEL